MKSSLRKCLIVGGFIVSGLAVGTAGIYVSEIDDAPGAALMGLVLMTVAFVLAARSFRRKT